VPAKLSVSPAGSQLEVRVVARVCGQLVRVGGRTSEVGQAGASKVKVPIERTWRLHLTVGRERHTAERFWQRG
jgi:hypothetical protein